MKKIVKIINNIFIALVFLVPTFMAPEKVSAQTLGDLLDELNAKQVELNEKAKEKQLTSEQMSAIRNEIATVKANIEQTYVDIADLTEDIANLNVEIDEKNIEMQELISFVQISNGEPAYLEYIFGAQSFTDFIYRVAVAEQLADYNDQLIDEYNSLIAQNEKKQDELLTKREDLANQKESLESKYNELNEEYSSLEEESISIADDIAAQKEIVLYYKNDLKCSVDESLSTCISRHNALPAGTAFYRPLDTGYITSNFGPRWGGFHDGIDQSSSNYGTNVYAVATGRVVYIFKQQSCGGNEIIIHHQIIVNGKSINYTSVYAHLLTINVGLYETVDKNTVIGTMGGGSDTWYYDKCSTGAHLHLTVSTCLYGINGCNWNTMMSNSVDPRLLINYPAGLRNSWTNRITKY